MVKAFSNNKFTLAPSDVSVTFEVTISNSGITSITGSITIQGGVIITGPGEVTPTGADGGNGNPGGTASGNPGGGNPGGTASGNPGGFASGNPGGGNDNGYVYITNAYLTPFELDLEVGESATFTVNISPSNATNKNVKRWWVEMWSINGGDVVSLEDTSMTGATVLAKSIGTAMIYAELESFGNWLYSSVYVQPIPVTSVGIYADGRTSLSLAVGEQDRLEASVYPNFAGNPNVRWTSSNPDVATLTSVAVGSKNISSVLVTPVSPGTAIITATTDERSGNKTASATVTVY